MAGFDKWQEIFRQAGLGKIPPTEYDKLRGLKTAFDTLTEQPYSWLIYKKGNLTVAKNGSTGGIIKGKNASTVMQSAINTLTYGGKIFVKRGAYNFGTNTLEVTMKSSPYYLMITGEGRNTKITGSGTNMIDITNTSWVSGILELKNLFFEHNAPASGITLDFTYGVTRLKNILVKNTNATKTGKTGIKIGPNLNSPHATWDTVSVVRYGTGIDISLDHILLLNPVVSETTEIAYHFSAYSMQVVLIDPHVYLAADGGNCVGYKWTNAGRQHLLLNPHYETHAEPHNAYAFEKITGWVPVIYNFDSATLTDKTLLASGSLKFINYVGSFITVKRGDATISAGSTSVDVPHGLAITPDINKIKLTPKTDTGGKRWWVEAHPTSPENYFVIKIDSAYTVADITFNWSYD